MEDQCDDDYLAAPFHRNRRLSEKSSTLSAVIALDEQLFKRQVICISKRQRQIQRCININIKVRGGEIQENKASSFSLEALCSVSKDLVMNKRILRKDISAPEAGAYPGGAPPLQTNAQSFRGVKVIYCTYKRRRPFFAVHVT